MMTPDGIRAARKSLGLTQAQMARALHFSRQATVSNMETGKAPIKPQTAELVRAYLDGYRPADWPKEE
jgi:DNA-binding XRE family transcriptional regulator